VEVQQTLLRFPHRLQQCGTVLIDVLEAGEVIHRDNRPDWDTALLDHDPGLTSVYTIQCLAEVFAGLGNIARLDSWEFWKSHDHLLIGLDTRKAVSRLQKELHLCTTGGFK